MTSTSPRSSPAPRARIDGLDGLRALAVVAVLLYHAEVGWAAGGFLGVDVFFVLSGYLVTSIVIEGFRKRGNLGFRRFWAARFRRLAPAQVALLVAVTLVTAIWHRDELGVLRGQVWAALGGVTNWYLIATQTSYFSALGRPPVLRHLWSLAVELQFYLVFPPVLVVLLRVWRDRLDRVVLAVAGAALASTVICALLYDPQDISRAYFDTFARLAAPLVGALLALVWRPRLLARSPAQHAGAVVSGVGIGALAVLLWLLHTVGDQSRWLYQRGGFLLVALLSAAVIAAVVHPAGVLGRRSALANPVLVGIGLRSYAIYLWHWPIYALIRPRIDVGWSWGTTFTVRILLTVICAELCYRFVERPWHLRAPSASFAGVRERLLGRDGALPMVRYGSLAATVLVAVALVVAALPHATHDAAADQLRKGEAAVAAAANRKPQPVGTTAPPGPTQPGQTTTIPEPAPGTSTVTLVGDSVMVGAAPALLDAFGQRANIDAKVARQADTLAPIVGQLRVEGRLGQSVVLQVGINGTVTEEELRSIVEAAEGRRVFVINCRVPRSWEQSNNETIASVVPRLPKAQVIDWHALSDGHRDWFVADGVHLTKAGIAAYTDLIRRAVDSPPPKAKPKAKAKGKEKANP